MHIYSSKLFRTKEQNLEAFRAWEQQKVKQRLDEKHKKEVLLFHVLSFFVRIQCCLVEALSLLYQPALSLAKNFAEMAFADNRKTTKTIPSTERTTHHSIRQLPGSGLRYSTSEVKLQREKIRDMILASPFHSPAELRPASSFGTSENASCFYLFCLVLS